MGSGRGCKVNRLKVGILGLWMKSHMVNLRDCPKSDFCNSNEEATGHSFVAWAVAEVAR